MSKTTFHIGVPHFLTKVYPKIIMSEIKDDSSFTKRDFWPFQNMVQLSQIQSLPRSRISKTTSFDSRLRFSNGQKQPRLPRGRESVGCPAPVTQNDRLDFKMS